MSQQQPLWWEQPDDDPPALPRNVIERGRWYDVQVGRARTLAHASDVLVLASTAAVPLTVALHADSWVPALLGVVAALTSGTRQGFGWHQNWSSFARARQEIERLVVAYRFGAQTKDDRKRLACGVEEIASRETGTWAQRISTPETTQSSGSSS